MKKIAKLGVMLGLIIVLGVGCEKKLPKIEKVDVVENISESINEGISKAIILKNESKYIDGQYAAESHETLQIDTVTELYREEDGKRFVRAYVLASYGKYNLENENYVRVTGSDVTPTILTFEKTSEGTINLINYQVPNEKKDFEKEVKKMFPEELHEEILNIDDETKQQILKEEIEFFE